MNIRESSYGYWSSSRSFLWVAGGAALGVGNVARLPYLMSEHGGLIFLLAYVAALFVVGLPLLVTEWMLGRWMRNDLVLGFGALARESGARPAWITIGVLALCGGVMILSYYSVIAGWSAAYAIRSSWGVFGSVDADQARDIFLQLAQDPERGLSWHTIFMVMAAVIVGQGFREGIERAALRLVPAAFVIAIVLCTYALARGEALVALSALLAPDLARFGWRGLMEALHQAFFTLSLGMGAMIALGSYLPASAPLKRLALGVILMDAIFSLVAGLAVYAMIFNAGLSPAAGVALTFQVLPQALPPGIAGTLVAAAFYTMLFLVTLVSSVALLEPLTRFLMDRLRLTRVFAAVFSAVGIWYLGLGTLLSFSVLQDMRLAGRNFFEWMQYLTASWLAPLTALLICIFAARIMPPALALAAHGERDRWSFGGWLWLLRFPARIGLIAVLAYSIGLVDLMAELWAR